MLVLVALLFGAIAFACGGSDTGNPADGPGTAPAEAGRDGPASDEATAPGGSPSPAPDEATTAGDDASPAPPPGETTESPPAVDEPASRPVLYFIHTDW